MIWNRSLMLFAVLTIFCMNSHAQAGDPWADNIVQYTPGTGITSDFVTGTPFDNPNVILGQPTRFTSDVDHFGGVVTPLQSPFRNHEIVSIGKGGSLTVSFDEPVTDDPLNPFGIDLLIFGNSFLFGDTIFNPDFSFNPNGTFDGVAAEGGVIEVSDDGIHFFLVANLEADGLYPTNAYDDIFDPFATTPGNFPSDFTKPVDPTFDVTGKTFAEVLNAYDGSGGGAGIDLGSVGLSQASFVRISNPTDAVGIPEIDAFADVRAVPEPHTLALFGMAGAWVIFSLRNPAVLYSAIIRGEKRALNHF